jgi:nucleoside-diphosphate-sugar epimerase
MRVTVTGGTGFLGSFLVRDLLAKGVAVRVFGRPSARAGVLRLLGAEILPGDLSDITALARAIDGSDIVYHLAAKVGTAPRQDYFETNVAGTENVLAACAQKRIRQIVYASSLAVYGPVAEGERIDENTPLDDRPDLRDPYSESKIAAERVVTNFAERTGIATLIMREGIIFGPGRPLPIGLFAFRLGDKNFVFGDAAHRFPLNYVENLVDAMQVAVAKGGGFRQYNVLDDDDLTLGHYHELKSAVDRSTTRYYPGWMLYLGGPITEALRRVVSMGDTRLSSHQLRRALQDRWYDTSLIRKETGWQPRVSTSEAIFHTLGANYNP